MLSRVADSIYWMSRYLERVENYARLVGANISLSHDIPSVTETQWQLLLKGTHDDQYYLKNNSSYKYQEVIGFMMFDKSNPFSIINSIFYARENARTVKETLPKEVWEHINTFYHHFNKSKQDLSDLGGIQQLIDDIKYQCQLFYGIVDGSLTRKDSYYFLSLGKFVERADKTSRFLDIARNYDNPEINLNTQGLLVWATILKSASALNMYRQQYKSINRSNILEFLIKDRAFPRSLNFCLFKTEEALRKLDEHSRLIPLAANLRTKIESVDIATLDSSFMRIFIDDFQMANNHLDLEIQSSYF